MLHSLAEEAGLQLSEIAQLVAQAVLSLTIIGEFRKDVEIEVPASLIVYSSLLNKIEAAFGLIPGAAILSRKRTASNCPRCRANGSGGLKTYQNVSYIDTPYMKPSCDA